MMRPLLVIAVALLAGCTWPDDSTAPDANANSSTGEGGPACPDVAEASSNAPLLTTLQEDPEAIAHRMAKALGGNLTGAPEADAGGQLVWRDGEFVVTVSPGDHEVAWERLAAWTPGEEEARATLRRALEAFDVPDVAAFEMRSVNGQGPVHLAAAQTYDGQAMEGVGASLASGERAYVSLHALREIEPGIELLPEATVLETASAAARCAMDQEGRTAAGGYALRGTESIGLTAVGSSLARVVTVRFDEPGAPSHCGAALRVHVDAVTGKVLQVAPPECD